MLSISPEKKSVDLLIFKGGVSVAAPSLIKGCFLAKNFFGPERVLEGIFRDILSLLKSALLRHATEGSVFLIRIEAQNTFPPRSRHHPDIPKKTHRGERIRTKIPKVAAQHGDLEGMKLLITLRANITSTSKEGGTPASGHQEFLLFFGGSCSK